MKKCSAGRVLFFEEMEKLQDADAASVSETLPSGEDGLSANKNHVIMSVLKKAVQIADDIPAV